MSIEDQTDHSPPAADAGDPEGEIAAVVAALASEVRQLVAKELDLARAELRESGQRAAGAGAGFGAAALLAYLAVGALAVAGALGLAEAVPAWAAFLVVGALLATAAATAFLVGRRNLAALSAVPHRTIDTFKEDVEWLRARMS